MTVSEQNKKRRGRPKKIVSAEIFSSVNEPSDVLSDSSIDIESFLVSEQLYCTEKINEAISAPPKKIVKQALSDLDKIVLSESVPAYSLEKSLAEKKLPLNGVKIKINKNKDSAVNTFLSINHSAHQIDLREPQKKEIIKPLVSQEDALPLEKNTEPTWSFNQSPSLIKQGGWFKNVFAKRSKVTQDFSQLNEPELNDAEPEEIGSVWRQLKTAAYFALIALLFIVPIRAFVLYNQAMKASTAVLGVTEEAVSGLKTGLEAVATGEQWDLAAMNFSAAGDYFSQAQTALNNYNQSLMSFVEALPVANKKVQSAKDLLEAGRLLSAASAGLSSSLAELQPTVDSSDQSLAKSLGVMRERLTVAINDLKQALTLLGNVDAAILPTDYANGLREIQHNLPALLKNLDELEKMFKLAESLAGYDTPKRYLLIFQNNNELRATGGFMGSFALIDIKAGEITNLEVPGGGFYDLQGSFFEKIIAPYPMQILGATWQIWNANWWPDFTASAQKIMWFFEKSGWPTVDGVITVNASILPDILRLTGNISLPQYEQLFTPENVITALQQEAEFEYDKKENKPKKIIGDLVPLVSDRLFKNINGEHLIKVFALFNTALNEKEIQFYFNDSNLEKQIDDFGWSGRVNQTSGDYLMVVRDNIAGGKTDDKIEQKISHEAKINSDGKIIDTVDITLTHNGDKNDVFGKVLNKSFVRVYVPLGSKLLAVSGYDTLDPGLFKEIYPNYKVDNDLKRISGENSFDSQGNTMINDELGKTVFGNWLLLQPGKTKTLSFSYELPLSLNFEQSLTNSWLSKISVQDPVLQTKYSFVYQNQSGVQHNSLESLLVLPETMKIKWSEGTSGAELENIADGLYFASQIKRDSMYGVVLEK